MKNILDLFGIIFKKNFAHFENASVLFFYAENFYVTGQIGNLYNVRGFENNQRYLCSYIETKLQLKECGLFNNPHSLHKIFM